ncbi:MAG: hypothetical protein Q8L10_05595 [Candidatus Moranbacteria bacterium]|nr:hypothetical protein [Candidatus Moranbacteria bacterium]
MTAEIGTLVDVYPSNGNPNQNLSNTGTSSLEPSARKLSVRSVEIAIPPSSQWEKA